MAESNNTQNVSVGKGVVGGYLFSAPAGTTLPTDYSTALANTFSLLGFTSAAGVQIAETSTTQAIRAWEGRVEVYNVRSEYTESVSFMPIQCNADVAKLTWGDDMVVVGTGGALTAKHHGAPLEPVVIVIETTPRDGIVKRYAGTFQLVERGEQTLDGTQVDGRQLTFNAIGDANGVTMFEFTAFTDGD